MKMKIGLHSAILGDKTFEEAIKIANKYGYKSIELACWPRGKADRRYAGVSHLDVANTSDEYIKYILDYAKKYNIEIVALGYYPNPLDSNTVKANEIIEHLKKVIYFSHLLKINKVSTFIGRNKDKPIEENLILFKKVWENIIAYAESLKVYIGIENCPMFFTKDEWPNGTNLAYAPYVWKQMFKLIDSPYFGLSYDPSHLHYQGMDYLKVIHDFKDKLVHVHLKDIKVDRDKFNDHGIFAYPLQYMTPKIPGLGGIDWKKFMNALKEIKYDKSIVIEIEDKDYENTFNDILTSIDLSIKHIKSVL